MISLAEQIKDPPKSRLIVQIYLWGLLTWGISNVSLQIMSDLMTAT